MPRAAGWIFLAWLRVVETSVADQSRGGAQCPHDRKSATHVDHMSVTCVASHVKCLCTGPHVSHVLAHPNHKFVTFFRDPI